ncbi:hypothetical protein C0389_01985 [bacterium]|nr:hypothetical protein [bacterium]
MLTNLILALIILSIDFYPARFYQLYLIRKRKTRSSTCNKFEHRAATGALVCINKLDLSEVEI